MMCATRTSRPSKRLCRHLAKIARYPAQLDIGCYAWDKKETLVKICGITSVADCEAAVKCGADLIGMIMWPKAKRAVSDATAAEISNTARKYGALPVGVFVDESAEIIVERCERAKLEFAQLHGDLARQSLHKLPLSLRVIYVMHATTSGEMVTELPSQQESAEGNIERVPDCLLIDSMKGGSGQSFDWQALEVPVAEASHGWLLAGGLSPANVAEAVLTAQPDGVDVSSGVCAEDGLLKEKQLMSAFVSNAKSARSNVAV